MQRSKPSRLQNIRLSDQAAHQIQTLIIEDYFRPGDRLPSESEFVESLKVSRSSVREALRVLESKGIIRVRPGLGAFVSHRPFSFHAASEAIEWLIKRRESLVQILQVREVLEGLAASLLANRITKDVLDELSEIVREQYKLAKPSPNVDSESDLDIRFHQLIARASGNLMVEEIVSPVIVSFCSGNRAILYVSGKTETSVAEHQRIIDALATKVPLSAEGAMRAHIARVRADILSIHPDEEQ